jgi:hypothetical protein
MSLVNTLGIKLGLVIAPPFRIEKAGLIMTLSGVENQIILLRIATCN